jgi:hypothetical protein
MTLTAGISKFLCIKEQLRFSVYRGCVEPALWQGYHLKGRQVIIVSFLFQGKEGIQVKDTE